MHLPDVDQLVQVDLLEVKKRELLMRFTDSVVQVYASAGPTKEARELINMLRTVYFVGHEESERKQVALAAQELEELSRKVFMIRPPRTPGGPATLEIT